MTVMGFSTTSPVRTLFTEKLSFDTTLYSPSSRITVFLV